MPRDARYERLTTLVATRGRLLLGTAVLLTGDRQAGEDLLQHALERVLRRWRRIEGDPEGYLRRTMYNLATDRRRQQRRRPEVLGLLPPVSVPDGSADVDLRDALVRALAHLPPRQRAVLVLRCWEDRAESEVAEILGCSVGTVKSSASRALSRLRELTGPDLEIRVQEGRRA